MPLTRRDLIAGSMVVLPLATVRFARRELARSAPYQGPVVVSIFQRGGADGLNIVAPYADGSYHDLRPKIGLEPPGQGTGAAIDLDGFFGLHPSLEPIKPLYDEGALAFVHAAGNPVDSHSHFACQDYMERGLAGQSSLTTGWLGRHLATHDTGNLSPFRALAIGPAVQRSLVGDVPAFDVEQIANFALRVRGEDPLKVREALLALDADPTQRLDTTVQQTFTAIDAFAGVPVPKDTGGYPKSSFGTDLRTLAQLIKAGFGVEAASVDIGGWDHHQAESGAMPGRLADLAAGLAAFVADLGGEMSRVTVVVMTEFGRRAYENASGGTDHGHGGVMLALGAGVNGGKVHADWPGLDKPRLFDSGDLQVTTDFRAVLGELLAERTGDTTLGDVFPGYPMPALPGVFRSG